MFYRKMNATTDEVKDFSFSSFDRTIQTKELIDSTVLKTFKVDLQ